MTIYVRPYVGPEALSPLFTTLRLRQRISLLPSLSPEELEPLRHAELGRLYHGLSRQLKEGHGVLAAGKRRYLVELAMQNFDQGYAILTNSRARQYVSEAVGKPASGYHVAGKAAQKFAQDIQKLAPNKFSFEAVSPHATRVRWLPYIEDLPSMEEFASAEG